MERKIVDTGDGSKTIHLPEWNESYHSKHGAVQEALHVFIESGLKQIRKTEIQILEVGFGTGLNCLLTLITAKKLNKNIIYTGLEAFPVSTDELSQLAYESLPEVKDYKQEFLKIHEASWEELVDISPTFKLEKVEQKLNNFNPQKISFDLIYFDAFGPRVQPEMWTLEIFKKLFYAMNSNGILVTYCAKGQVRRDLIEAGFQVEKIPGPPGKREMLRGRVV
ncbi:MAG: tRNA (5-methylaminomethyl-2-thiouridine)(34)-methyltransferase MnmD [Brumimicrobium sp.]